MYVNLKVDLKDLGHLFEMCLIICEFNLNMFQYC